MGPFTQGRRGRPSQAQPERIVATLEEAIRRVRAQPPTLHYWRSKPRRITNSR